VKKYLSQVIIEHFMENVLGIRPHASKVR